MNRVLIAIGGNALILESEKPTIEAQMERSQTVAQIVADLVASGHQVTVTHGNGPQVGAMMRRAELADMAAENHRDVPPLPLWLAVADSQGGIGHMLAISIQDALAERGLNTPVAAIITHCEVDANDPAFMAPTKPIGSAIPRTRAPRGWDVQDTANGLVRRIVASPRPLAIQEADAIETLVRSGVTVVAGGGGGVPVVRTGNQLKSVDAVIDKDLTSALLASQIGVDELVLVTGVPHVFRGFGTPKQQPISVIRADAMAELNQNGEFPPGSMKPKIDAALEFLEAGGKKVIITDIPTVTAAANGHGGTQIISSHTEKKES